MRIRNRIAAGALAIACLTGAGIATAAPAQAADHGSYVSIEQGRNACKSDLNSEVRAKLMFGYTVYNLSPCEPTGNGLWSGSFSYNR